MYINLMLGNILHQVTSSYIKFKVQAAARASKIQAPACMIAGDRIAKSY